MTTTTLDPIPWRDRKRAAWLLSLAVPALIGSGPLAYVLSGQAWVLWLPLAIAYLGLPLLDFVFGEDPSNPPEEAVPALEADRYYRYVTWALVPMLWAFILGAAWLVSRMDLPWHGWLAVAWSTGLVGGFCINVGHELGHKREAIERWLAKLVLAPTAYGHFTIEHNRGHHRDVATPEDSASARFGESIWRFVWREMPGGLRRAWGLEVERLRKQGKPVLGLDNEIVQTSLITAALWGALVLWLGWPVLGFLIVAAMIANFQLTSANYIEHYGICRLRGADGRYESCKPHHSWNSNHIASNWALFHLQRHSDHHAHASRRYQSLRSFPGLPTLPTGYFGMFLLAYLPPLWFRIMNPRLLAAVNHDVKRINLDPRYGEQHLRRHGITSPQGPATSS
jgi:alkane 1-monooxygenase